jgi:hypothetical protein
LHGGQEQGDEHADDGDHHQKFDEGEREGAGRYATDQWSDLPAKRTGQQEGLCQKDPPAAMVLAGCWSAAMPARMLVAEASKQSLDGQVFWLSARSGPERPSHVGPLVLVQNQGSSAVAHKGSGA